MMRGAHESNNHASVCREVIEGLCLDSLGAERKEQLDEDLAPLIHNVMEDLAQQSANDPSE